MNGHHLNADMGSTSGMHITHMTIITVLCIGVPQPAGTDFHMSISGDLRMKQIGNQFI